MAKFIKILLIIDAVFLNLIVFYLLYQNLFKPVQPENINVNDQKISSNQNIQNDKADLQTCPAGCVDLISKIDVNNTGTPTPTPIIDSSSKQVVIKEKIKSTSYLPIPGSGNTLNNDWTSIEGTDFYMSTSDYPGLVGVYFEANIKLQNGNGEAYVRLYDVSNLRGVDSSTLSTSSQTSTFLSGGPIVLWSGFNHYKIQAKSLTADTTYFESGKLKIITEN